MDNVITAREFWDRKVDTAMTRFYYNGNRDEFIQSLNKLGYDTDKIEAILDNWMEGNDD